jgi:hypothetical protein
MQTPAETIALIPTQEILLRRKMHEKSLHSLRLEGLDEFLTPEFEVDAEAWIQGEITLESAISRTLARIRDRSRA